jgi:hypothetical protein
MTMTITMSAFRISLGLSLISLTACNTERTSEAQPAAGSAQVAELAAAVTAAPAEAQDAPKGSPCGCQQGTPKPTPVLTETDPVSGETRMVVGERLSNAVPTVSIKELTADPQRFSGKRVRVEGNVTAMCQHKQAWFALKDPGDSSNTYVRVITAPSFLVPTDSVGRKGRTEGTVQVERVPAAAARHYSDQHKLSDPAAPAEHRSIVMRATGAEFI